MCSKAEGQSWMSDYTKLSFQLHPRHQHYSPSRPQIRGSTRHDLPSASKYDPPRSISILTTCSFSSSRPLGASLSTAAAATATTPLLPSAGPKPVFFSTVSTPVAAATAADRHDEWYEWHKYGGGNACPHACGPPGWTQLHLRHGRGA